MYVWMDWVDMNITCKQCRHTIAHRLRRPPPTPYACMSHMCERVVSRAHTISHPHPLIPLAHARVRTHVRTHTHTDTHIHTQVVAAVSLVLVGFVLIQRHRRTPAAGSCILLDMRLMPHALLCVNHQRIMRQPPEYYASTTTVPAFTPAFTHCVFTHLRSI